MSISNPKISVVIPVYNVEPYLERCINSILNQTYKNLDIILVDDGSTDDCGKICDNYKLIDSRITVFHKENGGLSDARNYGIERAIGKYITFVDSDDYIENDYVEYLYNLLVTNKCEISLCTHFVVLENGKRKVIGNGESAVLDTKTCLKRMLYHDVIDTSAWAKLYDIRLFENVRYPKGKLFEDIGTTYLLFLQCDKIACGYSPKYNYIIRSGSIVTGKFNPKKLDLIEMTDKMAEDVYKKFPELELALKRRRVYARFSTLNQMLDVKNNKRTQDEIIQFILHNKLFILLNKRAPVRDKVAVILLQLGFPLYRFVWKRIR